MSLKELQLPSIASLRAVAALKSPHLGLVRPARIGLGFESVDARHKSLAEVEETLAGPGRLALPYSLRWLLDVLTGLGVLHRALGFVHGEVQPENVVLGEDGVGRLIPVVRAHWVRGEERAPERLYYLAPEKLLGDHVDVRADVFSAGVLLWEALAGQRLLEAFSVEDIIARLMGGGIPLAQVPEKMAWTAPLTGIAERALAVDPGRRFASVAEMKAAIEGACQRHLASPAAMAELFRDPPRHGRSHAGQSLPPDSQRATLPPDPASRSLSGSSGEEPRSADGERSSRNRLFPFDLEEELTTKPNNSKPFDAAPTPVVAQPARHVKTLLGVPPPPESTPALDSVTLPASRSVTTAPPVVIPSTPPRASQPPPAPLPFGKTRTQFGEPEPVPRVRTPVPTATRPLPETSASAHSPFPDVPEPSFELLVRTRKRRGLVWLGLGVAAAVALLAAAPHLARQLGAGTAGAALETPTEASDPAFAVGIETTASSAPAPHAPLVGIASTPPAPQSRKPPSSPRTTAPEKDAVFRDRTPPSDAPAPQLPDAAAAIEPAASEPAAEPSAPSTPTPAPPPPSPPPPKPPANVGDRYGI